MSFIDIVFDGPICPENTIRISAGDCEAGV